MKAVPLFARALGATLAVALVLPGAPTLRAGEIRIIGGPGITPPPRAAMPPERIEPRPAPAKPAAPIVMRRAAASVERPERLRIGRLVVHVDGVDGPSPEEDCTDPDGTTWPCGARARAAIAGLIRLNGLVCPLPSDLRSGEIEAACRLGGIDYGARVVAAGWARARVEGPFADEERAARDAGRGIWGPAPASPTSTMPDPPADLPPDPTQQPLAGGGG